jgi:hypothetical protein
MTVLSRLLRPFAESIYAKAAALRTLDLTPQQKSRFRESIGDDIRKCTDLLTPSVSRAAAAEAAKRGLDLRTPGWHHQHKFDTGRKVFHLEHCVPVGELRERCMKQRTVRGVLGVLTREP